MFVDFGLEYDADRFQVQQSWHGNRLRLKWGKKPLFIKLPRLVSRFGFKPVQDQPWSCQISFEEEDVDVGVRQCLDWLRRLERQARKVDSDLIYQPKLLESHQPMGESSVLRLIVNPIFIS